MHIMSVKNTNQLAVKRLQTRTKRIISKFKVTTHFKINNILRSKQKFCEIFFQTYLNIIIEMHLTQCLIVK